MVFNITFFKYVLSTFIFVLQGELILLKICTTVIGNCFLPIGNPHK